MNPSHLSLLLEETRLITALSSIRTQLNEFIPISILPPEILENIFALCIHWLFIPHENPHPLAWTQVCRKWRCISLNAPRLWSYIDVCNDRLAAECLARSANVPVHVISSSLHWKFIANKDMLTPHVHRITSINVLLFPEDIEHLFSVCTSLPNLTTLSVKVPPIASNVLLDRTPDPRHLPSLRRLTLWSVSVPWTMCVGLTTLHLRGLVAGYSPTIEQLLDVFRASPCIEEIQLEHIIPTPTDSETPQNFEHLHLRLPTLRQLHLTSKSPFKVHQLFSCLSLPLSAHVSITCPHFERFHDLFPGTRPEALFPHLSPEITIEHSQKEFSLFTRDSTKSPIPDCMSKFMFIRTQRPWTNPNTLLSDIISFFNINVGHAISLDLEMDDHRSGVIPSSNLCQ